MPYEDYLNQIPGIRRTKYALKGAYDWAGRKAENFMENVYHPIFRQAGGIVRTGFEEAERNKQGIPYDVAEHRSRLTTNLAKANIKQEAERNAWQEPLRTQPLPFTPEEPFNRSSGLPETTRNNVLRNQPVASQVGAASHLVPPQDRTSTRLPRLAGERTLNPAGQSGMPYVSGTKEGEPFPPGAIRGGRPYEEGAYAGGLENLPIEAPEPRFTPDEEFPPTTPAEKPPEGGWLQRAGEAIGNISQPALMGLATTGLSMMAKGGQYTEKPQTLGGIAGEAGLAGLGTYLTLKEREEARATKEKTLAATQEYQKGRLANVERQNAIAEGRLKEYERSNKAKEILYGIVRENVLTPEGKIIRRPVGKMEEVTPVPTMDSLAVQRMMTDPNYAENRVLQEMGLKGSTVVDAYGATGRVKRIYFPNQQLAAEIPFNVYTSSVDRIKEQAYTHGMKAGAELQKQIRAEMDPINKEFAAEAKVKAANLMSLVGTPPEQIKEKLAAMGGGISQASIEKYISKIKAVRSKYGKDMESFHAWVIQHSPWKASTMGTPAEQAESAISAENLPPISSGAGNVWNRKPQP